MADEYISQVQLPNNETYNIKDKELIPRLEATVGHSNKNLLPITLESNTYTDGGANLTYTVDKAAGTITIDGRSRTDTQAINITLYNDILGTLMSGNLYASGGSTHCGVRAYDQDSSFDNKWCRKWDGETTASPSMGEHDSQENQIIAGHHIVYRIRIAAKQTINNEVIKPMFRNGSIIDDTFEPYQVPTDEKKLDKPVELDITTEWTIAEWIDLLNKYNYLQIITYTGVSFDVVVVPLSIFSGTTNEIRTVSYASYANSSVAAVLFTSDEQRMVMTLGTNVNIYKIIGIPK